MRCVVAFSMLKTPSEKLSLWKILVSLIKREDEYVPERAI
jgi:hypothetical protein